MNLIVQGGACGEGQREGSGVVVGDSGGEAGGWMQGGREGGIQETLEGWTQAVQGSPQRSLEHNSPIPELTQTRENALPNKLCPPQLTPLSGR